MTSEIYDVEAFKAGRDSPAPRTTSWATSAVAACCTCSATSARTLLDAGLRIVSFREHPEISYRLMPAMVEISPHHYRLPGHLPPLPLAFTLRAVKG